MSYRKIEVDGKTYEYVIGESYTNIKGVGKFYNQSVSYEVTPNTVKELIHQHLNSLARRRLGTM